MYVYRYTAKEENICDYVMSLFLTTKRNCAIHVNLSVTSVNSLDIFES